jgi:anion-transporting  ArsA/GET3 family ATPase
MSTQVIVCCGSGGVGKTTVSAALALKWALDGAKVVVVTIDPARRLADSLGLEAIGNNATNVPLQGFEGASTGRLDAVMLDAQATFDGLVDRFATDSETAERIRSNRYYRFASTKLGGAHEYMAAERVLQLVGTGEYDHVIVDTPPTRNALDFLTAPDRMARLMDGAVMRWMTMPATKSGWRALELGSEAVAKVLRRLVGTGTISEIAQFFDLFRGLWDGFHARSIEVHQMLRDADTRFLLVTTPAPTARSEALFFLDRLQADDMPFGGFVVNRVVLAPEHALDAGSLPADGPLPAARWASVCRAVADAPSRAAQVSRAHTSSIAALRAAGPQTVPCWQVPDQGQDIHQLRDLQSLADHLPQRGAITASGEC